MLIKDSLNITRFPQVISLIGGGGKTTTMYQLARELSAQGKKVLVTTTTHIAVPRDNEVEQVVIHPQYEDAVGSLEKKFIDKGILCLAREKVGKDKLKGIPKEWIKEIKHQNIIDVIIVEADGAKGKPFKAPAFHEPVLPEESNIIIGVLGIDALGKPITEEYVHRPDRILRIIGKNVKHQNNTLTKEAIAQVILHPQGLLKGISREKEIFILINKVEEAMEKEAIELARNIIGKKEAGDLKVLIGRIQDRNNPILQKIER